jgi:hypothetical protein
VYWKPAIRWVIDKIHVLNEIEFTNIRRNEVSEKVSESEARRRMNGATDPFYLSATDARQQRAALVLKNPVAEKEGVAGYEIALNYNGVAFALMPRAASEITGRAKFQLLAVNESEYRAHPCRKLVVQRGGRWQLTNSGLRELKLLTY